MSPQDKQELRQLILAVYSSDATPKDDEELALCVLEFIRDGKLKGLRFEFGEYPESYDLRVTKDHPKDYPFTLWKGYTYQIEVSKGMFEKPVIIDWSDLEPKERLLEYMERVKILQSKGFSCESQLSKEEKTDPYECLEIFPNGYEVRSFDSRFKYDKDWFKVDSWVDVEDSFKHSFGNY